MSYEEMVQKTREAITEKEEGVNAEEIQIMWTGNAMNITKVIAYCAPHLYIVTMDRETDAVACEKYVREA